MEKIMDSRFAPAVIQVARAEATPQPYGKVNDKFFEPGAEKGLRFGWKQLKNILKLPENGRTRIGECPGISTA